MDDKLDNFVDSVFGSGNLMIINGVLGFALIVVGIVLLVRKKSDGSKPKKTASIICIVAGIGIILSGIAQSLPL